MSRAAALRLAVPADWPVVMALRLSVRENRLANPASVTQAMYDAYVTSDGCGWVAETEAEIDGFCIVGHDGLVWALFVRPGCEGRGLGQALLRAGTAWLASQGIAEARLQTDAGTRAERFYRRFGWIETDRNRCEITFRLPLARS